METKHTKGEWTTEECSSGGLIVCLGDSKDWGSQRVQIVSETNAKLIAAAPKLLEALIELEQRVVMIMSQLVDSPHEISNDITIQKVRNAIKEATK